MKKSIKTILILTMVILTALCLTACKGSSEIAQPSQDASLDVTVVTGSCTVEQTSDTTVRVTCTTNLMDGTVVAICVDTFDGKNIATKEYAKGSEYFYADLEIPKGTADELLASLVITPAAQPSEVKQTYGSKLQNLSGDYVIWNTSGNCVVIFSDPFVME